MYEKLVYEVQIETLSSTFFYNIQNNKAYINDKVQKTGVILKKSVLKKVFDVERYN